MHGAGISRNSTTRISILSPHGVVRETPGIRRIRPHHCQAGGAAFLPTLDSSPKVRPGSYDKVKNKFNSSGKCATCHVPPLYTEPGYNMHTPAEMGSTRSRPTAARQPHVPHGTAGKIEAPARRAVSSTMAASPPCSMWLTAQQYAVQPEPQRRKQEGSGRVLERHFSAETATSVSSHFANPSAAVHTRPRNAEKGPRYPQGLKTLKLNRSFESWLNALVAPALKGSEAASVTF